MTNVSILSVLPPAREWWEALRWVLLIFSLTVIATLAGSFVSYEGVVRDGHPWLPEIVCSGCILCGMTRSFCAMSAGFWHEAYTWNRGGPLLYLSGWIWTGTALIFAIRRLILTRNVFRSR